MLSTLREMFLERISSSSGSGSNSGAWLGLPYCTAFKGKRTKRPYHISKQRNIQKTIKRDRFIYSKNFRSFLNRLTIFIRSLEEKMFELESFCLFSFDMLKKLFSFISWSSIFFIGLKNLDLITYADILVKGNSSPWKLVDTTQKIQLVDKRIAQAPETERSGGPG